MRKNIFPKTSTISREHYLMDPKNDKTYVTQNKLVLFCLRASLRLFDKASFLIKRNLRIFVYNMAIGFEHGGLLYNPDVQNQIKNIEVSPLKTPRNIKRQKNSLYIAYF